MTTPTIKRNPWSWIPTLYFAEGLPYVAVMTIAVIMYKRLGLSNTEIALYTSWLYLPWTIKPLWSPFVDLMKTKRAWIIAMQGFIAAGFAGIAFFIPTAHYVQLTLAFFWLLAFSSATHDIAADGFYMLGLNNKEQSFFVGIRNTFYRLANIFGQGILVMLAGWLETSQNNIPLAWSITFYLLAGLFLALTIYHRLSLRHPDSDIKRPTSGGIFTEDRYSMRDCASDDGEFGAYADNIQNTNNGNWSPIKTYDDSWTLYRGIRAANSFIAEIAQVDFTRYEHDGQYTNWMKQLKYFPYEARVLRAHYFFELARRYGDIAMPLEVLTEEEANTIGKTPFSEVISFIVSECDDAANNLPDSYVNEPGAEIGRVTKGFAMAVKSKALLYAASKLHNPSMDTELWKKSAKAAIDIINTGRFLQKVCCGRKRRNTFRWIFYP